MDSQTCLYQDPHAREPRPSVSSDAAAMTYPTTLIIRGIASKCDAQGVMQVIDTEGFEGTYNFFYLPVRYLRNGSKRAENYGYAFINFRSELDSYKFVQFVLETPLTLRTTPRMLTTEPTALQGISALRDHFKNTAALEGWWGPVFLADTKLDDGLSERFGASTGGASSSTGARSLSPGSMPDESSWSIETPSRCSSRYQPRFVQDNIAMERTTDSDSSVDMVLEAEKVFKRHGFRTVRWCQGDGTWVFKVSV